MGTRPSSWAGACTGLWSGVGACTGPWSGTNTLSGPNSGSEALSWLNLETGALTGPISGIGALSGPNSGTEALWAKLGYGVLSEINSGTQAFFRLWSGARADVELCSETGAWSGSDSHTGCLTEGKLNWSSLVSFEEESGFGVGSDADSGTGSGLMSGADSGVAFTGTDGTG